MGATVAAGNGRVFISYRRQETAWPARQLYELLAGEFGADKIFKDVDNIAPGEDFVDRLTSAVSACEVLLALIGPQWLDLRDAEGNRRIDDPHDFVRLELAAALQRGVRVIPILVDGARMPAANTLPPELAPLTRRQAVEINPVGFNTERLVATLGAPRRPADIGRDPPGDRVEIAGDLSFAAELLPLAVPHQKHLLRRVLEQPGRHAEAPQRAPHQREILGVARLELADLGPGRGCSGHGGFCVRSTPPRHRTRNDKTMRKRTAVAAARKLIG